MDVYLRAEARGESKCELVWCPSRGSTLRPIVVFEEGFAAREYFPSSMEEEGHATSLIA